MTFVFVTRLRRRKRVKFRPTQFRKLKENEHDLTHHMFPDAICSQTGQKAQVFLK